MLIILRNLLLDRTPKNGAVVYLVRARQLMVVANDRRPLIAVRGGAA